MAVMLGLCDNNSVFHRQQDAGKYLKNNYCLFVIFFLRKQQGSCPYVIAYGGSTYMSIFGYLTAFQEMMDQVKL